MVEEEEQMKTGGGHGNCPYHKEKNLQQNEINEAAGVSETSASPSPSPLSADKNSTNKGKSCKGCLYYSSTFKSNSRNPVCVGLTRSLPSVPRNIVGETEMEASKEGRTLTDFTYGCVGYSVYSDRKDRPDNAQEMPTELPVCVGLEILVDRRLATAGSASASAPVHNREDGSGIPPPQPRKPTHAVGDEFLSRFSRNAGLVAMGVAKNLRKVGNRIKESVDDILYPYGRRPK